MRKNNKEFDLEDLNELDPELKEKIKNLSPKQAHELLTSILCDKEIINAVSNSKNNKKNKGKNAADIFLNKKF